MKLLKKEDIQQDYGMERKLLIDEGMKLAKKVDALRATVSQEEQRLKLFREQTLFAINEELAPLILRKGELVSEIRAAEEQRRAALEPIDTELAYLKEEEDRIAALKAQFVAEEQHLALALRTLEAERATLRTQALSLEHEKYSSTQVLQQAHDTFATASQALEMARSEAKALQQDSLQREQAVAHREANVLFQEKDYANRYKALDKRERNLNAKETLIKDRFDTLLRTEKELKKRK